MRLQPILYRGFVMRNGVIGLLIGFTLLSAQLRAENSIASLTPNEVSIALAAIEAAKTAHVPLVVAGERDRLTPPAHARRIAEELPDCAGLIVLPETGHMSPLERPRELSEALVRLVDATSRTPAGARPEGLAG